jgi:hypothetical protein
MINFKNNVLKYTRNFLYFNSFFALVNGKITGFAQHPQACARFYFRNWSFTNKDKKIQPPALDRRNTRKYISAALLGVI